MSEQTHQRIVIEALHGDTLQIEVFDARSSDPTVHLFTDEDGVTTQLVLDGAALRQVVRLFSEVYAKNGAS